MRVTFCGVGEAFDADLPNTCLYVATDVRLLLDCGFTAAHAFWRSVPDAARLDAVYISHFHGDHFFGLPALLGRFMDVGRTVPLAVVSQTGGPDKVLAAVRLAYPNLLDKLGFALEFVQVEPGDVLGIGDTELRFAPSEHSASAPCLAVRADHAGSSMFYSGDGRPTPDTLELARGCGLLVQEAYGMQPDTPGHGSVPGAIDFAREAGAAALALVHLNHAVRRDRGTDIRAMLADAVNGVLPEPGDTFEVTPRG